MLLLRWYVGKALNFFGFTSPIRECEYTSSLADTRVVVRQRELFTVVTVNGLDVYFHRLTGQIDGIGFNPTADCKLGPIPGLADPGAEPCNQATPSQK